MNLTSIFPENFSEGNYSIRKKRLIADYLNIDEDVILTMSDEEIEELVKKNELAKKKINYYNYNRYLPSLKLAFLLLVNAL